MTWRQTVEQWHGGQLVIAWGLLAGVVAALVLVTHQLAERWGAQRSTAALGAYADCLGAPLEPSPFPIDAERSPRVGFPLGCRVPLDYEGLRVERIKRTATTTAALGGGLLAGAPALWLTWGWFGARAGRATT